VFTVMFTGHRAWTAKVLESQRRRLTHARLSQRPGGTAVQLSRAGLPAQQGVAGEARRGAEGPPASPDCAPGQRARQQYSGT